MLGPLFEGIVSVDIDLTASSSRNMAFVACNGCGKYHECQGYTVRVPGGLSQQKLYCNRCAVEKGLK